ncbi:MAG: D-2-hydroxyacid dehydrogenase [Pseudomonadota bacterium]
MNLPQFFVLVAGLSLTGTAIAQSNIEELIAQTGVEEGSVALRELPGWRKPQKIIVRDVGLPRSEIERAIPGVEVVLAVSESQAIDSARGADAIIGWCSEPLLRASDNIAWVQILSAGAERCVTAGPIADGSMVLTNMQKMSSPVLAEHAITLTLSLARQLPYFAKQMTTGQWRKQSLATDRMQSIAGKTLLVVGLGGIGMEVAKRADALDMRVIGTRRSSREGPAYIDYVGLSDELLKLAGEADFIVVTLPLTPDTRGLLDREFFNATKRGAKLVNVGRGPVVVTDDLLEALRSGQISGAALDVTDPEPLPPNHPLWQMENVLITPHVAARGGSLARHMILLKENLRRFAAGDALLNVVDPRLGY